MKNDSGLSKDQARNMLNEFVSLALDDKNSLIDVDIACDRINDVCEDLSKMLHDKNRAYGNSIFNPKRIFSQADVLTAINVRLDDKFSRIMDGDQEKKELIKENEILDIVGYLILRLVYEGWKYEGSREKKK